MSVKTIINLIVGVVYILSFLYTIPTDAQFNQFTDADNFTKVGDYQSAIDALTNYIELNPGDEKAFIKRALVHQFMGQQGERDLDLKFAEYLNPYSNLYISMSSRFRFVQKKNYNYDFDSSNESFSKSPFIEDYYKRYFKDNIDIHAQDSLLNEAMISLNNLDLEKTSALLSQIQETENIKAVLYDLKGLVALKQNKVEDAIDLFTEAIASDPRFPLAYHNRAVAYKLTDKLDKAKEDLMKAIDLNEDISVFYFTLAKLNERQDQFDNSSINYQTALKKNPDYLEARINYSFIQKTLGNYELALNDLSAITELNPDNIENHFIKGGLALTYGEYENAIIEFDDYLEHHPDDSKAIFNRGLAKILLGDKSEGCQEISDSIDLESNTDRQELYFGFCNDL